MAGEALAHEELAAVDMVGAQRRVAGARDQADTAATLVAHILALAVVTQQTADEADIVEQHREDHVQPVVGGDAALAEVLAPEDRLAGLGDHHRVADVVIGRVAVGDVLQRDPAREGDHSGIVRLELTVDRPVVVFEPIEKRVYRQ